MKRCWETWIKATAVRAVKTIAQTAVATIGTSTALGQVDWVMVGSASLPKTRKASINKKSRSCNDFGIFAFWSDRRGSNPPMWG